MLVAFLLVASIADCVPARWATDAPASVDLVKQTPVNCLLLEREHWSPRFVSAAADAGIGSLGVIHPDAALPDAMQAARDAGLSGVVLEGIFERGAIAEAGRLAHGKSLKLVKLPPRADLDLQSEEPVIGTFQGLWPGIHTLNDGSAKAAPTGAPWIDTNTGFLRFVRASSGADIWMGNRPPEGEVIPVNRYLQAIGDAAMVGARWIVGLDSHFSQQLLAGEEETLANWRRIGEELAFWEEHRDLTTLPPAGGLAVIEDVASGGLLSNAVIDMITARHTPLRAVPPEKLDARALEGALMAVNVNPQSLSPQQSELIRGFARAGRTILNAPPGWTFPPQRRDQIVVDEADVEKLDNIWRGVNGIVGRENLGVRLFNVASMRSELVAGEGGKPTVLVLLNYSDYPVENVTARVSGEFERARLLAPGGVDETLEIWDNGDVDIAVVDSCALLVLE